MKVKFGQNDVQATGEIHDGLCVSQEFIAKTPKLLSVNVYFATYMRENAGTIVVDVKDSSNKTISEGRVDAARLMDNSFREFGLGAKLIPGLKYKLRIWTIHCRSGQSVTAYYGRQGEGGALFVGARLMRHSELYCEFNYEGEEEKKEEEKPDPLMAGLVEAPPIPENAVRGLVSIVIPHYNCPDYLVKCLATIARQTYSCLEVILVDDGSAPENADKLKGIVESMQSVIPSLRFFGLAKNGGAPAARNYGAKEARGEYLFFCDSDVFLYAETLETLVRCLLTHPECDFAYGGFIWGGQRVLPVEYDEVKLRDRNFVTTMSLMRRIKFPGWDEKLKRHQDWDMWLTMVDEGSIGVCCGTYLFESPVRAGSISTNSNVDMMESRSIVSKKHSKARK